MTDRFQPIRDELRRYPELPRFTLSRGTVTDLVEALSTTEAALAESHAEIERMKAACQHSSQTLEGEGLLRCELCGAVERDPFWRNPA